MWASYRYRNLNLFIGQKCVLPCIQPYPSIIRVIWPYIRMHTTLSFYHTRYLECPYILMHRAYPLPLEKPSSLTLSCGLGFGFGRMVLAYFVDHYGPFQGISLDFLYLVRDRRRQSPKVRGVKGGRTKMQKKKRTGKKKKKVGKFDETRPKKI